MLGLALLLTLVVGFIAWRFLCRRKRKMISAQLFQEEASPE